MSILSTILLLSALTTSLIATQQTTYSVRQAYGRRKTFAQLQQVNDGTCAGAGHTNGCCGPPSYNCNVAQPGAAYDCYCSRDCYEYKYNDCCDDIRSIGCFENAMCDFPSIANGVITYNKYNKQNRVNTVATYTCNEGYSLIGNSTRTCQESGWSGSPPTCEQTCDILNISNGSVSYQPASSPLVTRTVATYTCNDGYGLNGGAKRFCQGSEGWSGEAPQCELVSCQVVHASTGGCASKQDPLGSLGNNARCSCNDDCLRNEMPPCCDDVGCIPQNCYQAGISPGCCEWNNSTNAFRYKGGCLIQNVTKPCFCDQSCRAYNDCCWDALENNEDCSVSQAESDHAQSVRARLMSEVQLAHPTRPARVNQAASRDLVSELKSMIQSQAEKRQHWEVIAKELESMQHKKT